MRNLTEYLTESTKDYSEAIEGIKAALNDSLENNFTLSINGGLKLNNRFYNRVGGYAIESMINNILSPDDMNCDLDARYMSVDIEIKSIKDKKYSAFNRMFTDKELSKLNNALVLFVDYSNSGNTFTINQITICDGSQVLSDENPNKSIKNTDPSRMIKY